MTREEAKIILECMATDMIGAMAGMRETMPMLDVLRQRVDAINIALTALTQPTQEQVEKMQGEWIPVCDTVQDVLREFPQYEMHRGYKCSLCGRFEEKEQPFCNCGAPMTDKAVEMVMERLEELNNA